MSIELPKSFIAPERNPSIRRRAILAIALFLAVLTGWQVFGLPGTLLTRNTAPPDMTGKVFGLRDLWIDEPGTWTITRTGYLDRMELYRITPDGTLWREREMPTMYEPLDVSGIAHGSPKMLPSGFMIDVKASPRYWKMLRSLRPDAAVPTRPLADTPPAQPSGFQPPTPDELAALADAAAAQATTGGGTTTEHGDAYVPLEVYHIARPGDQLRILPGHEYFPSLDSWAFADPYLWLTTDNQRQLHLLEATEEADRLSLTPLAMVEIDTRRRISRDCVIGYDPRRRAVFQVLANGNRLWYDPRSLALVNEDQLPGVWEPEHATLSTGSFQYVHDQGIPLSRAAYARLMSALMVIFLGSLLAAATIGRQAWRSTSAATIADSDSSSSSSST